MLSKNQDCFRVGTSKPLSCYGVVVNSKEKRKETLFINFFRNFLIRESDVFYAGNLRDPTICSRNKIEQEIN